MLNKKSQVFNIIGILLSLSPLATLSTPALAAEPYPIKPVRIIMPDSPGSGTDGVIRLITPGLAARLGKQVIVENRPGAGGIIAAEYASKADPDGYTLYTVTSRFTIQPALGKLPYDPVKSFIPIGKVASAIFLLSVNPSVQANSVKELIALAKAKPGQLRFASSGQGTTIHMGTELFKVMADIDFKIVQFKGAGPANVDVVGGHSDAIISTIPGQLPFIDSGKLRVLATTGSKRSVFRPNDPTVAEAALPGYQVTTWYGFLAPAGTPKPIVNRLSEELKVVLDSDETKKRLRQIGMDEDYSSPGELASFIKEDLTSWASVIKKAKIDLKLDGI